MSLGTNTNLTHGLQTLVCLNSMLDVLNLGQPILMESNVLAVNNGQKKESTNGGNAALTK